jgi:hypothetical protein
MSIDGGARDGRLPLYDWLMNVAVPWAQSSEPTGSWRPRSSTPSTFRLLPTACGSRQRALESVDDRRGRVLAKRRIVGCEVFDGRWRGAVRPR